MKTAVFDEDLPRPERGQQRAWEFFTNLKKTTVDRKFTLLEAVLPDGPSMGDLFGGQN